MVLYPRVACKVSGLSRLDTSDSKFPTGAVVDFVFEPSPDGCVEPTAGDVLSFSIRVADQATPETVSSATLVIDGNRLRARMEVPFVMAGDSSVDSSLDGNYAPGDDTFSSVAARLVLSRTVDAVSRVLAVSPAVWIYPMVASSTPVPSEPGAYYLSGPDGRVFKLSLSNPEGLGISLALEETDQSATKLTFDVLWDQCAVAGSGDGGVVDGTYVRTSLTATSAIFHNDSIGMDVTVEFDADWKYVTRAWISEPLPQVGEWYYTVDGLVWAVGEGFGAAPAPTATFSVA